MTSNTFTPLTKMASENTHTLLKNKEASLREKIPMPIIWSEKK